MHFLKKKKENNVITTGLTLKQHIIYSRIFLLLIHDTVAGNYFLRCKKRLFYLVNRASHFLLNPIIHEIVFL